MKIIPHFSPLAALLLVTACSQTGVRTVPPAVADARSDGAETVSAPANEPVEAGTEAEGALPKQALTPEILFKFLVAEVAGQRGAIGVAQSTYLDLARQTRDPRIARRAAEVSMFARDQAGALEATRLWADAQPESVRARQTLAALLLNENRLDEAEPLLRELLRHDSGNAFLQLSALMGKVRDTGATLELVERLAAEYPALPEARFAVSQAAASAGRYEEALVATRQADALRPGWEPAALLHAQVLAKISGADALAFMHDFLARHAGAREVRLAYARTLVNANRFPEAHAEFTRLTQDFPRNAEVSFAAALLALQMGETATARDLLTQTLEYGTRDPDAVHYYLGQVAEQMKQTEEAEAQYAGVRGGNHLVPARIRQAAILARTGRTEAAHTLLAATRGETEAQEIRLVQVQAELWRNGGRHETAFETLNAGLERFPDAPDLLYDRAMVAEKLDRLDVLEADLRRVIALRPEDAQAYNALGYTLADRTDRIVEAVALLERAMALSPDDPFILDSVGWAQFRSGNLARAQEYLERAFKTRPDPEIAAHLGEVLWARGQRDEAGSLWQSSLQTHPQNEVLLDTLRRLKP